MLPTSDRMLIVSTALVMRDYGKQFQIYSGCGILCVCGDKRLEEELRAGSNFENKIFAFCRKAYMILIISPLYGCS